MVSCSDMLDTDSNKLLLEKDHGMGSINDTLYSMAGILSKLQPLADRYVLQGEIRADLMSTTEKADVYLQEMNSYNYSLPDNPYRNTKDYYAVINNCNYVIHNIDTTTVISNNMANRRYYVAAKTIRAWTYFQLGLGYNNVKWYDKPIIEVGDINNYTEMDLESIISVLIADLAPHKDENQADLGEISGYPSVKSFYPIKLMLGDLYLTRASINNSKGDYEMAATMYMEQINKQYYYLDNDYNCGLVMNKLGFTGAKKPNNWINLHKPSRNNNEIIGSIVNSDVYGYQSQIYAMNDSLEIIPTPNSIKYFDDQVYYGEMYVTDEVPAYYVGYYRTTGDYTGDIRKYDGLISTKEDKDDYKKIHKYTVRLFTESYEVESDEEDGESEKVSNSYFICPITRQSMIYLRYAEAVNGLGKPNLAMAVLKHGLSNTNIADKSIVPNHEKEVVYTTDENGVIQENIYLPSYMQLSLPSFADGYVSGVHMRGCGDADKDTTYVIKDFTHYLATEDLDAEGNPIMIPAPNTAEYSNIIAECKDDSIAYVNNLIFVEHALETSYEGNRFFDLYRFAKRYKSISGKHRNDNFFGDVMATKVSNVTLNAGMFLDENKWFIPEDNKMINVEDFK